MRFVFNSTPLIHFARAGLSWMIEDLEGEKYAAPSVYREVVDVGMRRGLPDAPIVQELVKRGAVTVNAPPEGLLASMVEIHRDLHRGEAETIALARNLEAIAIIDDPVARRVAEVYGVRKEGSYALILRALLKGRIDRQEAKVSLKKLVSSGWRCDIDLYSSILRSIEETPI